jgi:hypothetical protein
LEIPEHRVAEHFVAVAGVVARVAAVLRSGRLEVGQPRGIGHRERLEQQLVEERKDGGVRADAQRQRKDRDDGDERVLNSERRASGSAFRLGALG